MVESSFIFKLLSLKISSYFLKSLLLKDFLNFLSVLTELFVLVHLESVEL